MNSQMSSAGQTFLIKQNFEGVGYDNSETWTETLSGASSANEDNTSNVVEGSHNLLLTRGTGNCAATSPAFASQTEIWVYFIFRTNVLTNDFFFLVLDNSDVTHGQLAVRSSSPAGGLRIYNSDDLLNFAITTAGMSVDTNYHVWAHWNLATGAADCEFQTTDTKVGSGNNFVSLTGGSTTGTATKVRLQVLVNSAVKTFDKVRVSNTAIGSSPA